MAAHQCAWLDGERRAYIQCEAIAERGRPYCTAHALKALEDAPRPFVKAAAPKPAKVAQVVVAKAEKAPRPVRASSPKVAQPKAKATPSPKAAKVKGPRAVRPEFDLTGQAFGHLVVQRRSPIREQSGAVWTCLCDCGGTAEVRAGNLRNGNTTRCRPCSIEALRERLRARAAQKSEAKVAEKRHAPGSSDRWRTLNQMDGRRFGALVVQERAENDPQSKTMWRCLCDCGRSVTTRGVNLRAGKVWRCISCARKASAATFREQNPLGTASRPLRIAGAQA